MGRRTDTQPSPTACIRAHTRMHADAEQGTATHTHTCTHALTIQYTTTHAHTSEYQTAGCICTHIHTLTTSEGSSGVQSDNPIGDPYLYANAHAHVQRMVLQRIQLHTHDAACMIQPLPRAYTYNIADDAIRIRVQATTVTLCPTHRHMSTAIPQYNYECTQTWWLSDMHMR